MKLDNKDVLKRPERNAMHMAGLLGERFEFSRTNRLIHQEKDHLLFPFELHCPIGSIIRIARAKQSSATGRESTWKPGWMRRRSL